MVRIDKMSFFSHLPNCVCSKCGNERERFIRGKKVEGKYVGDVSDMKNFNKLIDDRYHYDGKFTG